MNPSPRIYSNNYRDLKKGGGGLREVSVLIIILIIIIIISLTCGHMVKP